MLLAGTKLVPERRQHDFHVNSHFSGTRFGPG
jgi:hypothetical protein